jgi:hypothetical protein
MPAYLYHAKSGDFFLYTAILAKRSDVQLVEADSLDDARAKVRRIHNTSEELATPSEPEQPKPAGKRAAAKKEAAPAPAPVVDSKDLFDEE